MDFGDVLGGLADSFGKFVGAKSAADAQAAASMAQQQAMSRQAELAATNTQTAWRYGALAIGMIVVVVLLTRNKVL